MTTKQVVLELPPQGILTLAHSQGARVQCLEGVVWVTEEGNRTDFVLARGAAHRIAGDGLAVLQALGAVRLSVTSASGRPQLAFPLSPALRQAA